MNLSKISILGFIGTFLLERNVLQIFGKKFEFRPFNVSVVVYSAHGSSSNWMYYVISRL